MPDQLSDLYITDQGKLCFLKKEISGITARTAFIALCHPNIKNAAYDFLAKGDLHGICFTTIVYE